MITSVRWSAGGAAAWIARARGRQVLAGMAIATFLAGCNESSGRPAPQAKPTEPSPRAAPPDAAPPPPPVPHITARLFVDTSGSMAGFFERSPAHPGVGTRVMAVHDEIDGAIAELGLGAATKCTVGERVTCDGVPSAPAKLASERLYHEPTSRLDKVLARVPAPAQIDPNQPPTADLLDDARVTLLVSDGMEVSADGGGSASCARGADPTCIRTLLQQRIAEGYGVWILGALLPFHGTHFPERMLTPAYLERAREHVKQLKFDPRNLGVAFSIGVLGNDPTSGGRSTYEYEGYKPLLVFVLSRDAAIGRALVGVLEAKLRAAPVHPGKMRPEDTVHSVELAPLSATTTRAVRLEMAARREQQELFGASFDPKQLAEIGLLNAAPFGGGLSQKMWCGARGRAMMYLHYAQDGPRTLPAYLAEHVALAPVAGIPPRVIAPPHATSDPRILTGVDCAALRVAPDTTLELALSSALSLDDSAVAQQWWSRDGWSSTDAWQMPERVYRLDDLILPILHDRVTRAAAWGRVILHVDRK